MLLSYSYPIDLTSLRLFLNGLVLSIQYKLKIKYFQEPNSRYFSLYISYETIRVKDILTALMDVLV